MGLRPRDNPFSVQRIHALAWRPAPGEAADLDALLTRWRTLGGRGALVGSEGRGKTTLLDQLGEHWRLGEYRQIGDREAWRESLPRSRPDPAARRLRRLTVRRDRGGRPSGHELARFLADVAPGDLLLVDGEDHLPPWHRWRLRRAARRAAGLLVTRHREGALPTLLHCETTPSLLAELVDELLAGMSPPVSLPTAEDLYHRHAGNVRDALHELYDLCAGRLR